MFRRQRDFHCCGWNSYLDYAASHKTDLPDTCCHKVCIYLLIYSNKTFIFD